MTTTLNPLASMGVSLRPPVSRRRAAGPAPARRPEAALVAALFAALLVGLITAGPLARPASAASASATYVYTGAPQTFTVPTGVASLRVTATGAPGGSGRASSGGRGSTITVDLPVSPAGSGGAVAAGDRLVVVVGGAGGGTANSTIGTGGYNGGGTSYVSSESHYGGGGGGASDLRLPGGSLADRLVVGGGGGGGGGGYGNIFVVGDAPGGDGGAGGQPGLASGDGAPGGGAGTLTAGGAGGGNGTSGTRGQGGDGGDGGLYWRGGGGGGGYFGGGGGAPSGACICRGSGGGGGGSSYATPAATDVTDVTDGPAAARVTISWTDDAGPVIADHADVPAAATGPSGAAVTYTAPTASDTVDGQVTVSCAPVSGSTFALGDTTVTCSAGDQAGNRTSTSFTVTVTDTTAPTITRSRSVSAAATGASGAVVTYTAPTASDAVDGSVSVGCTPKSGSTFALGDTKVTCSASDRAGNGAESSFWVTVRDYTAPTLAQSQDTTVEATSADGAAVTYTAPTASDAVDGPVGVSCVPVSGSTFKLGDTTVTCTAADRARNQARTSFTVTVTDTTAPTLALPKDTTVDATGADGAAVTYRASASDTVDGAVAVACTPPSGSTFPVGATTVTCTATDRALNTAQATFTVTVTGADAQLADLTARVAALGLQSPLGTSLTDKLDRASASLDARDTGAACTGLGDFLRQVKAQSGKAIARADADELTAAATRLRAVLGC